MKHTHTREPWAQDWNAPLAIIGEGHLVAKSFYWSGSENAGRPESNARRIVACVNACEGINPDAVPELLDAAEILAGLEAKDGGRTFPTKEQCAFARSVIAKARGES